MAYVKALPDHQLLDRVVRGRAWIPLLGVLLAGIVAMQVEVLKLGAGIGRSIELSTMLQSRNELLRASVSSLADAQRIESRAAAMGMVMPGPDAINFLSPASSGAVQRAVANIHSPNAAGFIASLPALVNPPSGSSTAATGTSVAAATGVAPATSTAVTPGTTGTAVTPGTTGTAVTPGTTGTAVTPGNGGAVGAGGGVAPATGAGVVPSTTGATSSSNGG